MHGSALASVYQKENTRIKGGRGPLVRRRRLIKETINFLFYNLKFTPFEQLASFLSFQSKTNQFKSWTHLTRLSVTCEAEKKTRSVQEKLIEYCSPKPFSLGTQEKSQAQE